MTNVIGICYDKLRVFTLQETNEILPLVQRITEKHENAVSKILAEQWWMMKSGSPRSKVDSYDIEVQKELIKWGKKLTKLGVKALECGYVGFDSGCFLWSWRLGDVSVLNYHGYDEPPTARRPLNVIAVAE